jgi:hypothetical protein
MVPSSPCPPISWVPLLGKFRRLLHNAGYEELHNLPWRALHFEIGLNSCRGSCGFSFRVWKGGQERVRARAVRQQECDCPRCWWTISSRVNDLPKVTWPGLHLPTWCSFHTVRLCSDYLQCSSDLMCSGKGEGAGVSPWDAVLQ